MRSASRTLGARLWRVPARFTRDEILRQLDEAASRWEFPVLDNGYYYPVDVRLHGFSDQRRWAVVIETVGYNVRGPNLYDVLSVYGNCISGDPGCYDIVGRVDNFDEIADDELVAENAGALLIRGESVPIDQPAGTDLVDVFRSLTPRYRELLLADDSELRQSIPADLARVLVIDEWHHPDIVDGAMPSTSETFVLLSDALVQGSPDCYTPTQPPNTHWQNWPDGGTL